MNVKRLFPREMAVDVLNSKWIKQTEKWNKGRGSREARLRLQHVVWCGVVCLCRTCRCLSKRMNNAAVQSRKTWLSVGSEFPGITVSMSPAGIDSDCCTCHASGNERPKCHSTAEPPTQLRSIFTKPFFFFTKQLRFVTKQVDSSGNASHLYSGGARFEFQSEPRLSSQRISCFSSVHVRTSFNFTLYCPSYQKQIKVKEEFMTSVRRG
jgi:hypothetical protein